MLPLHILADEINRQRRVETYVSAPAVSSRHSGGRPDADAVYHGRPLKRSAKRSSCAHEQTRHAGRNPSRIVGR